jgi:hypothetical protein
MKPQSRRKDMDRVSDEGRIEFRLSDNAQLSSLQGTLSLLPTTRVKRAAGSPPRPGELGAADYLSAIGGSSALLMLIRMLPDFLRARRSDLNVEVSYKGKTVRVDATNLDQVMPILEMMLRD